MAFILQKTKTVVRDVPVTQFEESGKELAGKLKVRFNLIPRAEWDALVNANEDDDRLLFDVVVDRIEDEITGPDGQSLAADAALAAIRSDLSLTGQIVAFWTQFAFGAAAKNAQRSRAR